MANTIIISTIQSGGGDIVYVTGTVNGVQSTASASRAVLGSFANATTAQQYLAMLLLNNAPSAVSQSALTVTTGTVTL